MTIGLSMSALPLDFEAQLRISLIAPRYDTSISEFIEQLDGKKHAWYETYQYFKKKDYFPREPALSQHRNDQRPPQRQQQWPRKPAPPPNRGPQQRLLPIPEGAKAYFDDLQQEEDGEYDPPTDTYHAYPTFLPPGHTPRR